MIVYNFSELEKKWQEYWEKEQIFSSQIIPGKEKYYVLEMFPYPSGDLHMGHVRNYIIGDVVARYKGMHGFNVLHPIGWDSFGLPTENAAIARKIEPFEWNRICVENMEKQFRSLGISYGWDRVINTSNPSYYRWTQWLLIKFWEKGLLYQDEMGVNWCTGCNTVLANEQVVNERCERCNSPVILKKMKQWFLRITAYADRLLEDLNLLKEWPSHIITMQRNWIGRSKEGYNLRDWCISRQRYWGAPFPFVICPDHGIVPIKEKDLPVLLPQGIDITPGWPPPLARVPSFVETTCPICESSAERITDTLDTFVFSAWYYLRFTDPKNEQLPFSAVAAKYWMPVDQYIGGVEHATVHLMYARFFHKVLYDLGLVEQPEPFPRLFAQGMVCLNGSKMSKSKGNVVTPDEMIRLYGADATRLYTLFLGPPEQEVEWSENGVKGCSRFIFKIASIANVAVDIYKKDWRNILNEQELSVQDVTFRRILHNAIRQITESIEKNFHFNTAISRLMELVNSFQLYLCASPNSVIVSEAIEKIVLIFSPFAPHIAEEIWESLGYTSSVCKQEWPQWDEELAKNEEVGIAIQLNGKTKGVITVSDDDSRNRDVIVEKAKEFMILRLVEVDKAVKVIFVPAKVVNFVIKD